MSYLKPTPAELAEWIQSEYGTCDLGSACLCLKAGWPRPCKHWMPVKAYTLEELAEIQKRVAS